MRLMYLAHTDLPSDCENWIANALSRAGVLVYKQQRKIYDMLTLSSDTDFQLFLNTLLLHKIQVVLINKVPEFKVHWIKELRSMGIIVVWWTFDRMAESGIKEWFIPLAIESNICFMTDGNDSDNYYKDHGINRIELHQGFDPIIHRPYYFTDIKDVIEFECDVAFLGSAYTFGRKNLINFLKKNYGDRFKHYGGNNGLRDGVWGDDFRKAVMGAKVIVGDNFTNDVDGYWSDRIYLTLACKGYFITHYVKGLEKEFEDNKHICWWSDLNELKTKIDRSLEFDNIRNNISHCGYELVKDRDSYDERIKTFLKYVEELL